MVGLRCDYGAAKVLPLPLNLPFRLLPRSLWRRHASTGPLERVFPAVKASSFPLNMPKRGSSLFQWDVCPGKLLTELPQSLRFRFHPQLSASISHQFAKMISGAQLGLRRRTRWETRFA